MRSVRVFAKNMYYEPTIVVHDTVDTAVNEGISGGACVVAFIIYVL